jgi:hypothetical protein
MQPHPEGCMRDGIHMYEYRLTNGQKLPAVRAKGIRASHLAMVSFQQLECPFLAQSWETKV